MPAGTPNVRMLFATPVIERPLVDGPALAAALKQTILRKREVDSGINRSNIGGWHSDTEMLRWSGEAGKTLALAMLETCGAVTEDIGMRNNQPRYEMGIEMWANVSPAGVSNQMHAHPGAVWSGVFYVDDAGDAEDGNLILLDPRFPMSRACAPDLRFVGPDGVREENTIKIRPVIGNLVVFPAWLMHGVQPHRGLRDRISIAMNVMANMVRR